VRRHVCVDGGKVGLVDEFDDEHPGQIVANSAPP
jgi:hypothetical protein